MGVKCKKIMAMLYRSVTMNNAAKKRAALQ